MKNWGMCEIVICNVCEYHIIYKLIYVILIAIQYEFLFKFLKMKKILFSYELSIININFINIITNYLFIIL